MLPTKLKCHAVTAGADSPVSRLCTARNAGVLMLCTKASNHKPVTTRLVRRDLWMSPGGFSMSRRDSDSEKVPAALYDRLTDTPTYAARMYKVQRRGWRNPRGHFCHEVPAEGDGVWVGPGVGDRGHLVADAVSPHRWHGAVTVRVGISGAL